MQEPLVITDFFYATFHFQTHFYKNLFVRCITVAWIERCSRMQWTICEALSGENIPADKERTDSFSYLTWSLTYIQSITLSVRQDDIIYI